MNLGVGLCYSHVSNFGVGDVIATGMLIMRMYRKGQNGCTEDSCAC